MDEMPEERTIKVNFWTAAYTLERKHIRWITAEAKRKRVNKSKFLRDTLDKVMEQQEGEDAA